MRRHLFTISALISLLICVAALALWVRSVLIKDGIVWQGTPRSISLASSKGRLWWFCWISKPDIAAGPALFKHYTQPPEVLDISRQRWVIHYVHVPGFTLRTGAADIARTLFDVTVSNWLLALATVLLPARWLILYRGRWRREARLLAGCCPTCGYSLTGNTSGVCPECGAACKAADPAGVSPAAGD